MTSKLWPMVFGCRGLRHVCGIPHLMAPLRSFFLVEQGTFGSIRKLIDQFQRNTVSEPVPAPVRMSWGYEKNNGMVASQSHLSVTGTNISATRTNISSVISYSIDTLQFIMHKLLRLTHSLVHSWSHSLLVCSLLLDQNKTSCMQMRIFL